MSSANTSLVGGNTSASVAQKRLFAKEEAVACEHCGLVSSTNIVFENRQFCCNGCVGAYALIHQMGLDDYYSLRTGKPSDGPIGSDTIFKQKGATSAGIEMLKDLDAAGVAVRKWSDHLCEVRLGVEGIHCAACSWLIERMQPSLNGLRLAQVRMNDRSIRLVYDPFVTNPSEIASRLAPLGYLLLPQHDDQTAQRSNQRQQREHWIAIAVAAFLAANAMWIGVALYAGESTGMLESHTLFLRWIGTILGLLAAAIPGRIFFRSALHAIQTRTAHVDVPITIAITMGAIGSMWGSIYGSGHIYFDSLASLILLLRIGRYIQFRSQYITGLSLQKLFRWTNAMTNRIALDGSLQTVASSQLRKGDLILVKPAETLPVDGVVVEGRSHLNVSWLTGESFPQSITVGDQVVGGTMNIDSPIQVRVTECGKESRLGQLEEVIRSAAGDRTPLVRAADQIGKWFVISVLAIAVTCWTVWFYLSGTTVATTHTVALLTIACPCAIALAAPLVITIAIGRAAKEQIWIRDGQCLEQLAKPGIVWFDKTGTLTEGKMKVHAWLGSTENLRYAISIESQINHPIARAIASFALSELQDQSPSEAHVATDDIDDLESIDGLGVAASVDGVRVMLGSERLLKNNEVDISDKWLKDQSEFLNKGMTPVWLVVGGLVEGLFAVGDTPRHDAVSSLRGLQADGWRLGILSGDRTEVVHDLQMYFERSGVKFEEVYGQMTPEQKVATIRQQRDAADRVVVFVGDGINDAPALTVADVGIAIRGGSDISLRAAPIYIASNRLSSINRLFFAARATLRTIRRCFAISLLYNLITVSLAVAGLIHPLIAAIFMPISGLTVLMIAIAGNAFKKPTLL